MAPAITSAASAASIVGAPFNATVTTTGEPAPAITETGALPAGITFTDNGNGTATLPGTATAGTGGSYPLTITATNASGTNDPGLHADQLGGADDHQRGDGDVRRRRGRRPTP